jgi:hypothetical protein
VFFAIVIAFVNDRPNDIGSRADAFSQSFRLRIIIVAATAGDKQGAERFGGLGGNAEERANDK